MSDPIDRLRGQIDECTDAERKILYDCLKGKLPPHPLEQEWGVSAEIILSAISRSSDLTKRGVRGIIAEAVFERETLVFLKGWEAVRFMDDRPYDFLIRSTADNTREARIQVKLQRMKTQRAMLASEANRHYPQGMYVVEVQKTRGGIDLQTNADTRPYRFGEFDILAVNMHPSTKDWRKFLFTLSRWLLPRTVDVGLVEIFQPVAPSPNNVWTDNLETCLHWLALGEQKRILDIAPEFLRRRPRRKPEDL
jgi:hypothetical protein